MDEKNDLFIKAVNQTREKFTELKINHSQNDKLLVWL